MPVPPLLNNLAGLNAVVSAKGGALTYLNEINALNSIDIIEAGVGGYLNGLSALNSIDVLLGGSGGYFNELDAFNSIVVLEGGVGGWLNTIDAINEWVDNAVGGIVFFLDDQFTDGPVAAPISSPRVSTPAPGKLVIVSDVGSGITITAGNKLSVSGDNSFGNTKVAFTDDVDAGFISAAGLVLKMVAALVANGFTGFSDSAVPADVNLEASFKSTSTLKMGSRVPSPIVAWGTAEETFFIIDRSPGAVFLWLNGSGNLEVLWLTRKVIGATLWPASTVRNANAVLMDSMQLFNALGSSWATNTSMLDTYVAGSLSDPEDFTTAADAQINVTGLAAGETLDIEFRRQDDNNKWIARFDADTTTMEIIEVTAGSEVSRASDPSFPIASDRQYQVQFKGSTIKVYDDDGANTITYASATAFQTETSCRIAGATSTQTHLESMNLDLGGTQRETDLGL